MTTSERDSSRRRAIKILGTSAFALAASTIIRSVPAWAQIGATSDEAPILMDGHVRVINRVYWEKIDLWQPPAYEAGWDYARPRRRR